uniref:Uncharacterized protein n=1 Tax=Oryza nivara TaxID=4536 RepID=A0A0E0GX89_ORYNI
MLQPSHELQSPVPALPFHLSSACGQMGRFNEAIDQLIKFPAGTNSKLNEPEVSHNSCSINLQFEEDLSGGGLGSGRDRQQLDRGATPAGERDGDELGLAATGLGAALVGGSGHKRLQQA